MRAFVYADGKSSETDFPPISSSPRQGMAREGSWEGGGETTTTCYQVSRDGVLDEA